MSTFIKLAQPVSQSGDWIVTLAANPTIDIGTIDQGTPGAAANAWPMCITDGTHMAAVTASLALKVDGSSVVQPVSISGTVPISGSVTILGTLAVSGPLTDAQLRASALPISGNIGVSSLPSIPTGFNAIGSVSVSNFPTMQPVSGTFWQAIQPVSGTVTSNIGTTNGLSLDVTLSTMSAKLPATLGQKLMAASLSVTIASDQGALPISGTVGISGTVAVSGTVTANAGTGTMTISAAALPLPTGAATSALQTTGNTSLSSLDSKTPALGQALMASSTPVVLASNQTSLPVTGTFWQSTQPVSIASMPSTPVTGTFWQATQPVSIASMPSTPVTGVFFQATQPVSAASLPLPTGAAQDATLTGGSQQSKITDGTNVATVKAASTAAVAADKALVVAISPNNTVAVTGAFFQATQPVSGSVSVSNFPASQAVTNAGAFAVQAALNAETTKVIGTVNVAASQSIAITNAAAVAKGTQGPNGGIPIQALKDSGRNQTNFFMAVQIVSTATDTLLSLTGYKSGAAVAATTTPAVVTAGKTYRITSITLTYVTIVTTPGAIRFTLRANTGGTVLISSPAVINYTVGEPSGAAPVAGKFNTVTIPFPEGLEFAAGTGIGLSQIGLNTIGTAAAVGYGIASIQGYEY